jgi:hypothetical protein
MLKIENSETLFHQNLSGIKSCLTIEADMLPYRSNILSIHERYFDSKNIMGGGGVTQLMSNLGQQKTKKKKFFQKI